MFCTLNESELGYLKKKIKKNGGANAELALFICHQDINLIYLYLFFNVTNRIKLQKCWISVFSSFPFVNFSVGSAYLQDVFGVKLIR